jgi:hypothetical protein
MSTAQQSRKCGVRCKAQALILCFIGIVLSPLVFAVSNTCPWCTEVPTEEYFCNADGTCDGKLTSDVAWSYCDDENQTWPYNCVPDAEATRVVEYLYSGAGSLCPGGCTWTYSKGPVPLDVHCCPPWWMVTECVAMPDA